MSPLDARIAPTMFVTNDHGRHDYDFQGHGDSPLTAGQKCIVDRVDGLKLYVR